MNAMTTRRHMLSPPAAWLEARLGSVVRVQGGFAFKSSSFIDDGVPIIRMSNLKAGQINLEGAARVPQEIVEPLQQFQLEAGDILLGLSGSIENFAVVREADLPCYLNQRVGRFIPIDSARIHYPYIRHLIQTDSFKEPLYRLAEGAAQLNVSPRKMENLSILLPPLPEQRKIATILSSVDATIEKTEAVIEQLQVVKKAMMQELLTRGLPGRHRRFKMTEIGEVPSEWGVVPAEAVCEAVIDCKNRTPPYTDSGYPVIRTPNVRDGELRLDGIRFTSGEAYREWTARGEPKTGDVLITREAPVGEVCALPSGMKVCLGQRMMLYRPMQSQLVSDFLLAVLQSPGVQDRLRFLAGGSTVGHVRVGDIRRLPLPIPGLEEQRGIGEIFSQLATQYKAERKALRLLQKIKTSLMSVLLTGELRVTPDEPSTP